MKKIRLLAIILALVMVAGACLVACNKTRKGEYEITINPDKSRTLEVGDEVDFTQFFIVKDSNGNQITVTNSMLDLSKVNLAKPGSFAVTLTIGKQWKTATFIVIEKKNEDNTPKPGGDTPNKPGDDTPTNPGDEADLATIFAKYANQTKWNFAVDLSVEDEGDIYEEHYEYLGYNVLNSYESEGYPFVDYLGYDEATYTYYFYYDNGNGTYTKYSQETEDFWENYSYMYLIDLSELSNYTFTASGDKFVATNPSVAGNAIIAEYEDYSWTSIEIYVSNGQLTKVVGTLSEDYSETYTISNHGNINFTLPTASEGSGGVPTEPTGTMDKQSYNAKTFDHGNLQDKLLASGDAVGLPSVGAYHALVIPVQFAGDTITQTQLNDLDKAFNGTASDTGWESVSSYYYKSSYGKLDLTFDIQDVYKASYSSTYYSTYSGNATDFEGEQYTREGYELLLVQALAYYENKIDLTKYDFNDDGCIDAVYLIYSASVDYEEGDFFWAYTTWFYGQETYSGLEPYYYFFAGIDFMYESTSRDPGSGYTPIDGLTINAATYIHESGHLLGLDDYYDYQEKLGGNEGLGGADMMDWTVGDQNVYSKIMLGWLEPTIVNETMTVTIKSSHSEGSAILIPLNFNNSYFCEYLLIDLYAAQGLNALHSTKGELPLYGGEAYGVRIYHVSSSIDNPYSDKYYSSFTDYNNSTTAISLIKLVEADGEKKFASSDGLASASDLWKAGNQLSKVFPQYMRNDGKLLCFDITIVSVSATSATITITFNS